MNKDLKQPTTTPAPEKTPVNSQPEQPIKTASPAIKPKKKKTGLIIGIVTGSLLVIGIIAAVLVYFLWWQNPNKIVSDAIVSSFTMNKATTKGSVSIDSPEIKVEADINYSGVREGSSKFDIKMKMTPRVKLDQTFSINLEGIYINEGSSYIKIDGVEKALEEVIENAMNKEIEKRGYVLTPSQQKEFDAAKDQVVAQFKPIVDKFDGKWLEVKDGDFDGYSSSGAERNCHNKVFTALMKDKSMSNELFQAYRQNSFITVKRSIEDRNGGKGYEIDLDSKEAKSKAKSFFEAVEKTEFGKRMAECDEESGEMRSTGSDNSDIKDAVLKIWVDPMSHQLRAFEVSAVSKKDDSKIEVSFDINPGEAEPVEAPSDAESFKEVMESLENYGGGNGGGNSLPLPVNSLGGLSI